MPDVSVLPSSSTALERAIEAAAAVRFAAMAGQIPALWSIENCPEEFLGHLAWALSVDDWSDDWSADVKRAVIKASIPVHRRKGTPGSVRDAIRAVTGEAAISEWWQYSGPRHTFRVAVPPFDRPGRLGEIVRAITNTKPAHAHLNLLTMRRQVDGRVTTGGVVRRLRNTRHRHDPIPRVPKGRPSFGTVIYSTRTTVLDFYRGPPILPNGTPKFGSVLRLARTTTLQPAGYSTPASQHPDQVYSGTALVQSGPNYVRSTR